MESNHGAASEAQSPTTQAPNGACTAPIDIGGGIEEAFRLLYNQVEDLKRKFDEAARGPNPDTLWSRQDVSAYYKCSLRLVDSLIADNQLVPIKIGRLVRFHPEAVRALAKKSVRARRGRGVV